MHSWECLFALALGLGLLSACSGSNGTGLQSRRGAALPLSSGAQGVQTCADDGTRWEAVSARTVAATPTGASTPLSMTAWRGPTPPSTRGATPAGPGQRP